MSWFKVFTIVSACSLIGMTMGGLFGLAAGAITPNLFRHIIVWRDVEPLGAATFFGGTAGVLLGGGLGCFGIVIQLLHSKRPSGPDSTL